MKLAVLGAGMMGRAAVYDLARTPGVDAVRVADVDLARAEAVSREFGAGKTTAVGLDVADGKALRSLLEECDGAVGCVSYTVNETVSAACIDARTHYVDMGGNNTVVEAQFDLSARAEAADVALVPDCGIAPGAVSIFAARCLELLPEAESLRLRVGGLPLEPAPPFNYQVVFSVEGLLNEYKEPTLCLREGEVVEVPPMAELETLQWPAPFGTLEAFTTSGGASTLPRTFKGRVRSLDYKTLRYPGHCALIQGLFALGFDEETPRTVDGSTFVPRRVLEHQIAEKLSFEGPDVILALVEATAGDRRVAFRITDRADAGTGLSAMARCTSFPATTILHMLCAGTLTARGTLHQELSVPAAAFIEALRERGIDVTQE